VEQELIGEPISAVFGNLGNSGNFEDSIGMKALAGL